MIPDIYQHEDPAGLKASVIQILLGTKLYNEMTLFSWGKRPVQYSKQRLVRIDIP